MQELEIESTAKDWTACSKHLKKMSQLVKAHPAYKSSILPVQYEHLHLLLQLDFGNALADQSKGFYEGYLEFISLILPELERRAEYDYISIFGLNGI